MGGGIAVWVRMGRMVGGVGRDVVVVRIGKVNVRRWSWRGGDAVADALVAGVIIVPVADGVGELNLGMGRGGDVPRRLRGYHLGTSSSSSRRLRSRGAHYSLGLDLLRGHGVVDVDMTGSLNPLLVELLLRGS